MSNHNKPPSASTAQIDALIQRHTGITARQFPDEYTELRALAEALVAVEPAGALTNAEKDSRVIAEIWDSAKAEAAMYVEAHCVDGEVHAKHIIEQPRPKITPGLPKTGITAADIAQVQRDLARLAAGGNTDVAPACVRAQAVIEGLLSGLHAEQLQ